MRPHFSARAEFRLHAIYAPTVPDLFFHYDAPELINQICVLAYLHIQSLARLTCDSRSCVFLEDCVSLGLCAWLWWRKRICWPTLFAGTNRLVEYRGSTICQQ